MAQSEANHPHSAPRSSYQSNPLELVRPSFEGLKLNGMTYLWAVLAVIGAVLVASGVVAIFATHTPFLAFLLAVAAIVFLILYVGPGFYRIILAMAKMRKITFTEAFDWDLNVGGRLLGSQLLVGLAVLGGLILFIIPGLIFAVWFSLTPYVVIEEGLSGTAALKRSKALVANRFWDMAGTLSLVSAISIVKIVPILGAIVATVAAVILIPVIAKRYLQLKELKSHSDGRDLPTNNWNYGLIVLAIVAGGISGSASYHMVANPTSVENRPSLY